MAIFKTDKSLPHIEPLLSDPDYAELSKKREARQSERAVLKKERDVLTERILAGDSLVLAATAVAQSRINALADGRTPPTSESENARYHELNRKIKDLDDAVEYLSEKMRRAANLASLRTCETLRPQFDKIARDMVMSVIEAQAQISKHFALLEKLTDEGFLTHHWPDVAPDFMEATDKHGRLAHWLNEIAKVGIIDRSAIPAQIDQTK